MQTILLIPVYNESVLLPKLLADMPAVSSVFVNDGSSDGTQALLERFASENPQVHIIELKKNVGKSGAIKKGLTYLHKSGHFSPKDCVVLFDGDAQHNPLFVKDFVEAFQKSNIDMLVAFRDFSNYSFFKELGNRILTWQARLFTKVAWQDTQCGMRVFRLEKIPQIMEVIRKGGYCCEQEMCVSLPLLGWKVSNNFHIEVTVDRSNSTIKDAISIFMAGFSSWIRYGILERYWKTKK